MINPLASPTAPTASPAAAPAAPATGTVTKDQFLRLLVAQMKSQDPLNPADSIQYVTQLAQFSELEQLIDIRNAVVAKTPPASNIAGM